ncbi:MAG: DnaJ C-terminal domain-containing protein [Deltaproteobacteria bacterium]|nr:DnaJ C-terminal domain-containing protein [Deltaproteobacteria bacterium]
MKDLYKALGVSETASEAEIKKAYRKLAKEFHPDATGGDKAKTERFKEVSTAYDILGDANKRSEYDRLRHAPVGADGVPQGFDPDMFSQIFGGMGGGGFRGGQGYNQGDVGDIFANLFGSAGGGRSPFGGRGGPARGSDMESTISISLAEAATGTKRKIRTGSGKTVEVQIPAGVESGGRLRVAKQGGAAPDNRGAPGDLYLAIEVEPHPFLKRNEYDIELDLPLSLTEAVLGAKVEVPTVEGSVWLSIPPGTGSGRKLRLRGKGMGKPDGSRGDQLCRVEIVVPKLAADDKEGAKLVEELAKRGQGEKVRPF